MTVPVAPGQLLGGAYQVDRVLGVGDASVLVAAHRIDQGQRVTLRILLPEATRHPDSVDRFLREARRASRLEGEHVGRVIDVGVLDSGAPFMVTETIEGDTAAELLRREGPMPVTRAAEVLLQACQGVAEAHALGIVHRSIEPARLLVVRRGDGSPLVKVLDFSIAGPAASPYTSPEQLRLPRPLDARTDIWALGVTLHELVTGRRPFEAESSSELCLKIATEPLAALCLPDGAAPPALYSVIRRCLEKAPAARYPTVKEFADALAPLAPEHARDAARLVGRILDRTPTHAPPAIFMGRQERAQ